MIEDELFKQEIKKFNLTKDDYTPAKYPHHCEMCGDNYLGCKRSDAVDTNTPYLFICIDCYEELPSKKEQSNL